MTIYVDSAGSDTSPYDTWAKAANTLGSATGAAAGEEVRVAYNHDDGNQATHRTWNFANGTNDDPVIIISCDPADDTYRAGGKIWNQSSVGYDLTLQGSFHAAGIVITGTAGGSEVTFGTNGKVQVAQDCSFALNGGVKNITNSDVRLIDCDIACTFIHCVSECIYTIRGGSLSSTSASYILRLDGTECNFELRDCDMSGSHASAKLIDLHEAQRQQRISIKNCALPSAISIDDYTVPTSSIEICGCVNGTISAPHEFISYTTRYEGTVKHDSGRYRTDGADDGETTYSWDMTSSANCIVALTWLESPPIVRWVEAGSQTVKLFVASGATLNNDEFWIEVSSPDETANPDQRSFHKWQSSRIESVRATPAALTTDSVSTWNGSGVGTKQEISVSINPTEPGTVIIRCMLAKPSTTVYVDPFIEVS